jgi:hypothetical protein
MSQIDAQPLEDQSKDAFFQELADISHRMTIVHGKEFAMGTLIIAARFIAEGKPLQNVKEDLQ